MSEHTPGRLYIRTNRHPNTDGTPWGWVDLYEPGSMRQASPEGIQVTWSRGQTSEANARRLVACWNACDGVPTELLEAYPAPFTELRTQRDELLEALDELSQIASVLQAVCLGDERAKENRLDRALAAIAKVKGGSA